MESLLWMFFDLLSAIAIVGLAVLAVISTDSKRTVILFIVLGLVLALVWARLLAPDLALAEAALGAGITGALLLSALNRKDQGKAANNESEKAVLENTRTVSSKWFLAGALTLFTAVMLTALLTALEQQRIPQPDALKNAGAAALVEGYLDQSGVSNPVTAVLLNFRVYDTFLELAVLLAAAIGAIALGTGQAGIAQAGFLQRGLTQLLIPICFTIAGYLLWVGAHAPGGAFQGGAVLAAAGVLLHLSGDSKAGLPKPSLLVWVLCGGLIAFMTVGIASTLLGREFLAYPSGWSSSLILVIETAAMLSIAATLVLTYRGGLTNSTSTTFTVDRKGG